METVNRINPLKLGALLFVGLVIASSWLVMPYFVQGQQLLRNVGDDSRMIKAGNVSQYLTRRLIYTPDAQGDRVMDFSGVGYMGQGSAVIPNNIQNVITLSPVAGDDSEFFTSPASGAAGK